MKKVTFNGDLGLLKQSLLSIVGGIIINKVPINGMMDTDSSERVEKNLMSFEKENGLCKQWHVCHYRYDIMTLFSL